MLSQKRSTNDFVRCEYEVAMRELIFGGDVEVSSVLRSLDGTML